MNSRPEGYNPDATIELILAARIGNIEGALHALKMGADINGHLADENMTVREPYHLTDADRSASALHIAVTYRQIDLVKLLLNKSAGTENKNDDGETPLHIAVKLGELDVVELLLEHKANLETKDKEGKTPLLITRLNNDSILYDLLLQHGANAKEVDAWMKNQVYKLPDHAREKDISELNLAIDLLISVYDKSPQDLYDALIQDNMFRTLIIGMKESQPCVALMRLVDFLIESNAPDVGKLLPEKYIFANYNFKKDLFEHIKTLPLKDRIKIYDNILHNIDSPYYKIFHMKRGWVVGVNENRGILHDVSEAYERDKGLNHRLIAATKIGDIAAMQECIDQGADVNHQDINEKRRCAIHIAAKCKDQDAIKLLIQNSVNIDTKLHSSDVSTNGITPLFVSATRGDVDSVYLLLERGADPSATRMWDNATSLMYAAKYDYIYISRILIKNHALIDTFGNKEIDFVSPLTLAVIHNSHETLKLLIDHMLEHYATNRIVRFMQEHDNLKTCLEKAKNNDDQINQLTRIIDYLTTHGISKNDIQAMLPDGFVIPEKPQPVNQRLYPDLSSCSQTTDKTLQEYIDSASKRASVVPESVLLNPFTGEKLPAATPSTEPVPSDPFSAIDIILSAEKADTRPAWISALDDIHLSQKAEQSSTAHVLTQLSDLMTFNEPAGAKPYQNPFDDLIEQQTQPEIVVKKGYVNPFDDIDEQVQEANIAKQLDSLPPTPSHANFFTDGKDIKQEQAHDKKRVMLPN